MRFERLVIEAGDNTFSLDLHERLTVIAGVGPMEREGLVNELVGALSASRPGVHCEILADNGTRFALFRPNGGHHRVVDVDHAIDVTHRFADARGAIDLLASAGIDVRAARRRMRVTSADLATMSQSDDIVRRLAKLDPVELWSAAKRIQITDQRLADEAAASGSAPEDAEVVRSIEDRHQAFEDAQGRHERVRVMSFVVGAFSALAAVPTAVFLGRIAAMPFVLAAAVVTALSFVQFKRMEQARAAEQEALQRAGAESYLGFHLHRVNGLLADDTNRQQLMYVAEEHRESLAIWKALVGDVDVDWVLEHREDITTAARLHADVTSMNHRSTNPDEAKASQASDLAHALVGRLGAVRHLGPGGESFPLILDDPFTDLDSDMKLPLLELVGRSSAGQQVVILTEDDDVTSWGRLEALTGDVMVLEPLPRGAEATADGKHLQIVA